MLSDLLIVQLDPNEWEVLKELKLRALEQEPIAFEDIESAIPKYINRSEAEWRMIIKGEPTDLRPFETTQFFARINEWQYIGMVSSIIPNPGQRVATVQQMFVDRDYRGQGVGKTLLLTLLDALRSKSVTNAHLTVVSTQVAAIGLYESVGFKKIEETDVTFVRSGQTYNRFKMQLCF